MKVVINACYGGFGMSVEAFEWLRARNWEHMSKLRLIDDPGRTWVFCEEIPRHDPLFVQCVEELGDAANGAKYTSLKIVETGPVYRINEYDGLECAEDRWDNDGFIDTRAEHERVDAVAAEREACAEIAMGFARRAVVGAEGFARSTVAAEIEQAIRARSKDGAR